jgi:hypothetical protein
METYSERTGRRPSFEVRYRFLTREQGGRLSAPHQHTRWDFLYEGEDPRDSIWMIWPEFISSQDGEVLPAGEVPVEGNAFMFIVNMENAAYHRERIVVGTKGYFVEGPRRVAECEVVALHGLNDESVR